MNEERFEATIASLKDLREWFEAFGNYTRAHDVERLIDGLREYRTDILTWRSEQ